MLAVLIVLHILASLVLMLVILLQSGKAGDLAAAFGGASSQTAFGVKSATTLLTKITAVVAVIFVLTSLSLAIYYSKGTESTVMEGVATEVPAATEAPAAPVESAPTQGAPAETAPAGETPAQQPPAEAAPGGGGR
ncbi:MAG: preprotein translocase subunit SecG [Acidobacteriota bacterium]